jgi:hypothetical protein
VGLGGLLIAANFLGPAENYGQEVTFQEFKANYLESEQVAKIRIMNSQMCLVYLKSSPEVNLYASRLSPRASLPSPRASHLVPRASLPSPRASRLSFALTRIPPSR